MVKGISKQVVLVKPHGDALFEQAIFFVRDGAKELSDEELLRQAGLAGTAPVGKVRNLLMSFCAGSLCTGLVWLLTVLF